MKINGQKWEDFEASEKYSDELKAACRVLKEHAERRKEERREWFRSKNKMQK